MQTAEAIQKCSSGKVMKGQQGTAANTTDKKWLFLLIIQKYFASCVLVDLKWDFYIKFRPGVRNQTVLGWTLLTHWGRVMYICVHNLAIIGSDNGLSPGQCQAIIGSNAAILLIRTLGTNFNEIISEIHTFSFQENSVENVVCEMAAILCLPQCVKHHVRYTAVWK